MSILSFLDFQIHEAAAFKGGIVYLKCWWSQRKDFYFS